ncbi:MAG: HD domain-containing phosphohydrolase [Ktedonobacteraceae bacterium]
MANGALVPARRENRVAHHATTLDYLRNSLPYRQWRGAGDPLNEEEWAIMQQHTVIGARILSGMGGIFQQLAQVVLAHHERWDGYGYPRGLQGKEIPLAARVLGVVDSYDAMLSRQTRCRLLPLELNCVAALAPNLILLSCRLCSLYWIR